MSGRSESYVVFEIIAATGNSKHWLKIKSLLEEQSNQLMRGVRRAGCNWNSGRSLGPAGLPPRKLQLAALQEMIFLSICIICR